MDSEELNEDSIDIDQPVETSEAPMINKLPNKKLDPHKSRFI